MASSSSSRGGAKDLYKVLRVRPNATKSEIKDAYRKLAMALHPDKHDGCDVKSDQFKELNEAYDTLKDRHRRNAYDDMAANGMYNKNRRRPPPKDYRKVYSPRAPPGMNVFDRRRHFDMHYGDGMMREAVDAARKRYEAASARFESQYHYQSPLGKGFTFEGWDDQSSKSGNGGGGGPAGNPFSKKPQGPSGHKSRAAGNPGDFRVDYEEAHYYDLGSTNLNNTRRVVSRQETVRDRMEERKRNRVRQRGDPPVSRSYEEESGCVVM